MIIFFSGTGNSKALAKELASHTGDSLYDISSKEQLPDTGRRVIWAFPIYSWGLPGPVVDAIRCLSGTGIDRVPHFMTATCGDDAGLADRQWHRLIESRGWDAAGANTVIMPNTYTMMKGFDVDAESVASVKLAAFPARAKEIASKIVGGVRETDVTRGRFAWFKSQIIYPGFMRWAVSTKPFHATTACISCGKCAGNCPVGAIKMEGDHPVWNGRPCAMCERCYHACPVHAIAYGHATDGKGQYMFPTRENPDGPTKTADCRIH